MNPETVFSIVNALILPQWLLMILAPYWLWTQKLVDSYFVPIVLAIAYTLYIITGLSSFTIVSFSALNGVKKLFLEEQNVLTGWIHYLCFDLVAGTYIYKDSLKKHMNRKVTGICLFFCMVFGPIGFLLYIVSGKFLKNALG